MNISGKARIYRREFNGRPYFSTNISNKKQDGTYDNMYVSVQLPKDIDLPDKTNIEITKGFISNYKGKNGFNIKLVVQEYNSNIENTTSSNDLPF